MAVQGHCLVLASSELAVIFDEPLFGFISRAPAYQVLRASLSKFHSFHHFSRSKRKYLQSKMVVSAQFYRHSTVSSERKKLWDPYETLGIINTDPGYDKITCIGNAPTQGRRCRNPIKGSNREFIKAVLSEISFLPPDSPGVLSRLQAIVGPALCVSRHQSQAELVMQQWKRNIQQLRRQSESREERTRKPSRNSKQDSEKVQKPSIHEVRERMRELEELMATLEQERDEESEQFSGQVRRDERGAQRSRTAEQTRQMNEEMQREAKREEKTRLEKERLEKKRLQEERLERERLKRERLERERREEERLERERLEREKREEERLEKERKEKEETKRRKQEQAAHNERIRQRAAKLREDREREKREAELREQEEWEQAWSKYQTLWAAFRASSSNTTTEEGKIREAIPWPVKSGLHRDVNASNVRDFLQRAVAKEGNNSSSLLRKECHKWHPDRMDRLFRGVKLTDVDRIMIDMICRVVTELLCKSAGRSSEFVG
jgi:hypothetical protein